MKQLLNSAFEWYEELCWCHIILTLAQQLLNAIRTVALRDPPDLVNRIFIIQYCVPLDICKDIW